MAKSAHVTRKASCKSGKYDTAGYSRGNAGGTRGISSVKPIPPRASAYLSAPGKARSGYLSHAIRMQEQDITRLPTWPESRARSRQKPLPDSVAVSEIDTQPPGVGSAGAENSPHITGDLALADTVPDILYSAGQGRRNVHKRALLFEPLDRFRWWLLRPGRLEFALWASGAVFLVCITGIFLFTMVLSMGVHSTNQPDGVPGTHAANTAGTQVCSAATEQGNGAVAGEAAQNCVSTTSTTPAGLRVTMLDGDPMVVGSTLHLLGQGFSARGNVAFTHDADQPCQPATAQADIHGAFSVLLQLNTAAGPWESGDHQIMVEDTRSQHAITLTIMLTPQVGSTATITATIQPSTPTSVVSPSDTTGTGWGNTSSPPSSSQPGSTDTNQPGSTAAPVPSAPSQPSPTATPPPVQPTPTVVPTAVSITPTVAATPITTATTPTPASSNAQVANVRVLALNVTPLDDAGWSTSPVLWCCIGGYFLAMILLGIAGSLRRRG